MFTRVNARLVYFFKFAYVLLAGVFAILTFRGSVWKGAEPGRINYPKVWVGKYYRQAIKRRDFVCSYVTLTAVILHLGKIQLGHMANPIRVTPAIDWKTVKLNNVRFPGSRRVWNHQGVWNHQDVESQRWNKDGLYK